MTEDQHPQSGLEAGFPGGIHVALNALRWLAADEHMAPMAGGPPGADNLLDFLRGPFARASIQECVARYRAATAVDARLFALPSHDRLVRGVLMPLHNAKAEFILGHHLGCISLCGVVAEVLCVLRLDTAELQCGGGPLDDERQKALWGRTFGRLPHGQRISALQALGLIDEGVQTALTSIAAVRNKYLHIYGQAGGSEEKDALVVYTATCHVVVGILGLGIQDGQLTLHPDILRFLQR